MKLALSYTVLYADITSTPTSNRSTLPVTAHGLFEELPVAVNAGPPPPAQRILL
jgi:hypothetical protein